MWAQCPLLAQSGHGLVHCKGPLSGVKRTWGASELNSACLSIEEIASADWLYLPETLYALMLIMVVSAGAGPYSLDAVILPLIDKHIG
jgi:hypothetical protein